MRSTRLRSSASTARINSLGYFQENFEVEQVEGSAPDRIILEANVEEQPTGELQLSAGFSTLESFILHGSIRQRNFRGRGQTIGLGVNYSRYSRSAQLQLHRTLCVRPEHLGRASTSTAATSTTGNFTPTSATPRSSRRPPASQLRVGVPLTEYIVADRPLHAQLRRRHARREPVLRRPRRRRRAHVRSAAGRPLSVRCDGQAAAVRSSALSLIYNSLDSSHPSDARARRASCQRRFRRPGRRYALYPRCARNAAQVLAARRRFHLLAARRGRLHQRPEDRGAGVDDVLLTDRFFLGEPQIRGFDIRGVGPRVVRRFYAADDDGNAGARPDRQSTATRRRCAGRQRPITSAVPNSKFRSAPARANWACGRRSSSMSARCSASRRRSSRRARYPDGMFLAAARCERQSALSAEHL